MSANLMLREIGIALFLASVGIKAGANFVNTVVDGDGLLYVGCGFPYYSYTFINNGSGCTLALQDELFHVDGAYCR